MLKDILREYKSDREDLGLCYHCLRLDVCDDVIEARDREQTIIKCWNYQSKFGGM